MELLEKLKVSDGMGAWITDFQKSDAPQFKGKSEKERRDMAIAAYLSAKRGGKPQEEGSVPFKGPYKKTTKPLSFKQAMKKVKSLSAKGMKKEANDKVNEKLTPDQARQKISRPTSIPPHIIKKMRDAAKKAGK